MTSFPHPTTQARPQGGFNQMLGQFNDEYMEQNSMATAAQQKSLSQQSANPALAAAAAQAQQAKSGAQPAAPREVGSIQEELITRPAQDIKKELMSFLDINNMLGIKSGDTPEEKAKKQQLHQRWQKLDDEQRQLAHKMWKENMDKKKKAQEEEQLKRQKAQQAQANSIAPPSSPKKGPVGPTGSGKKRAASQMEMDRKTLSNAKGAN